MVRILTDSSCDISMEKGLALNIDIIPIEVHFNGKSFRSGIDITNSEFYEKLKNADKLPTTTQIIPITLEDRISKYLNMGDEVVCMFLSSEMSGTHANMVAVMNSMNSANIHIVDTKFTTFGLGLLVMEAVKLRDAGFSGKEIASKIQELVPRVTLYASLETLKYLKMGGRLSSTAAVVGGILGIYPIITIKNGKVESIGKARGRALANKNMLSMVEKKGISSDFGVTYGHSNAPDQCDNMKKLFSSLVSKKQHTTLEIGPIVGTHIGPGAIGIAFISK